MGHHTLCLALSNYTAAHPSLIILHLLVLIKTYIIVYKQAIFSANHSNSIFICGLEMIY